FPFAVGTPALLLNARLALRVELVERNHVSRLGGRKYLHRDVDEADLQEAFPCRARWHMGKIIGLPGSPVHRCLGAWVPFPGAWVQGFMGGSGFGVRGSGFGTRDSGFGIRDSGFGVRTSDESGRPEVVQTPGRHAELHESAELGVSGEPEPSDEPVNRE